MVEIQDFRRELEKARFSLVVTIEAPEVDVDVYTPVQTVIDLLIEV